VHENETKLDEVTSTIRRWKTVVWNLT